MRALRVSGSRRGPLTHGYSYPDWKRLPAAPSGHPVFFKVPLPLGWGPSPVRSSSIHCGAIVTEWLEATRSVL